MMTRNRVAVVCGFLALVALSFGCATARIVKVQPNKGGTITLIPAGSAEARQKAEALMLANCKSGKYEVTEEGEVVVGQVAHSSQNQSYSSSYNSSNTYGTTYTENRTEWQIQYKCAEDAPAAAAAPAAAEPAAATPPATPAKKKK